MKYIKPERLLLRTHPEFNELWVQNRITEDPSILGLGDVVVRDKERSHPQAGRLDLLLQDPVSNRRYELEIQLGRTDESHIIRTLEYWDIERKRYPQYDHVAVIVAEEITGRFLNVISLFNGFIPLVAIQLQALKVGDNVFLVCSTILQEVSLGLLEEDEIAEVADRAFWEVRSGKSTMELTDSALGIVRSFAPEFDLKYNKHYIGLAKNGQPTNFVVFHPKRDWVRVGLRLERSDEVQARLEQAGIDLMEYDTRTGRYRFRLFKGDLQKHEAVLRDLFATAFKEFTGAVG